MIGRNWVFSANSARVSGQAKKYSLVWLGNLILNASLFYLFTKFAVNYVIGKALASLLVGLGYNYPFQKEYVFKIK